MRVIIKQVKKSGKLKVYSSPESFNEEHENYRDKQDAIEYYLSRKKTFYEDENIKLFRFQVIGRKVKSKRGGGNKV